MNHRKKISNILKITFLNQDVSVIDIFVTWAQAGLTILGLEVKPKSIFVTPEHVLQDFLIA